MVYLFYKNRYDQVSDMTTCFDKLLFDKFVYMLSVADFIAFAANVTDI